ncbi:restriction endonuclease subunit S (plasmid) [Macrococcoides caseolyticum]|uniref:restriction endonuclease subunit S n=1 Tax=Macrococcoides caseolyticum TaxID=69966 RepID=UPI000CD0991B|nr:restriction endonuclease subunit S [Macrococcus caseolyticus]PNZ74215.1 hypothetical protein CD152_02925 [Macrococcus caseolyticus]QPT47864.1 restriction endonuclease subunit S [Macrococcus caseolyticus]
MKVNVANWKPFKISKLFRLEKTKGKISTELVDGKEIPYIGAKKRENGLMKMCKKDSFEEWISEGNCILFIQLGAGSAGYANYIPNDFIGMNGKTSCGYIDGIMNEKIGLFLATILSKERFRYSFGRSWTGDRLKNTIIKLPVKSDNNGNILYDKDKKYSDLGYIPDWSYMEKFIESLHHKLPITNNSKPLSLEEKQFKSFNLKDLDIKVYKAKAHAKVNIDFSKVRNDTRYPFVSRTEVNNSVDGWVNIDKSDLNSIEKGNALVIGDTTATISYQKDDFLTGDHIVVIRSNWLNKYTGLFIKSLLDKERYRYSYGRAFKKESILNTKIKLPIDDKGDPDWIFIKNYVKSMPYGDKV